MPATIDSSGTYVGCCLCYPGGPRSNNKFLPIKKTLYATWGSWAGDLIWDNTIPGYGLISQMWSGVADVTFTNQLINDGYGNCVSAPDATTPVIVSFDCTGLASARTKASGGGLSGCCLRADPAGTWAGICSVNCFGLPLHRCYTCEGAFAATLDSNIFSTLGPPCFGELFWTTGCCDLLTSDCLITEV